MNQNCDLHDPRPLFDPDGRWDRKVIGWECRACGQPVPPDPSVTIVKCKAGLIVKNLMPW